MGLASCEIVGGAAEWRVSHDGKAENVYQTKESAFGSPRLRSRFDRAMRCE
jgi:hypothetical protein